MPFKIKDNVLVKYISEDYVTEAVIPDSVTSIADLAFSYCRSLEKIHIPESVEEIGNSAFWNCENIEIIEVSENNKNYTSSDGILFSKDKKTIICFPCAKKCDKYIISESISHIGRGAFHSNKNIKSVTIPDSITHIENSTFMNCENLENVIIPDSVTVIGDCAFQNCLSIENMVLPRSITDIGGWAFSSCESLKRITVPDNVKKIGQSAFYDCAKLESVKIPDSIEKIGNEAFSNCVSLKSITIRGKKLNATVTDDFFRNVVRLKPDTDKLLKFICCNDFEKKKEIFSKIKNITYKAPLAVYLVNESDCENAKTYLKKNIRKIVTLFTDNNDAENLTNILPLEYITKKNIDEMIEYAIENKKPEIQLILSNYKNDNFGFANGFDDLLL